MVDKTAANVSAKSRRRTRRKKTSKKHAPNPKSTEEESPIMSDSATQTEQEAEAITVSEISIAPNSNSSLANLEENSAHGECSEDDSLSIASGENETQTSGSEKTEAKPEKQKKIVIIEKIEKTKTEPMKIKEINIENESKNVQIFLYASKKEEEVKAVKEEEVKAAKEEARQKAKREEARIRKERRKAHIETARQKLTGVPLISVSKNKNIHKEVGYEEWMGIHDAKNMKKRIKEMVIELEIADERKKKANACKEGNLKPKLPADPNNPDLQSSNPNALSTQKSASENSTTGKTLPKAEAVEKLDAITQTEAITQDDIKEERKHGGKILKCESTRVKFHVTELACSEKIKHLNKVAEPEA